MKEKSKPQILIVEKEKVCSELIKKEFADRFEINRAVSAVKAIRKSGELKRLVLVVVSYQAKDSEAFIRLIASENGKIPIIGFSNIDKHCEILKNAGATHRAYKPNLAATISYVLKAD